MQHAARYEMNEQEIPSLDNTNTALYQLFQDQKPLLVQFEADGSVRLGTYDTMK